LKDTRFFKQADLLLQLLPFFSKNNIFAIKGGTAIKLDDNKHKKAVKRLQDLLGL